MDCAVGAYGHWKDCTEYELVGILCAAVSIFPNGTPVDVEISLHKPHQVIPPIWGRSYSYNHKLKEIKNFCESLNNHNGGCKLVVIPLYPDGTLGVEVAYYIPEDKSSEFMSGYTYLNELINTERVINKEDHVDYVDTWTPDETFIKTANLVKTTKDPILTGRHFEMQCPAYLWDLPKTGSRYQEQLVADLLELFLHNVLEEDNEKLIYGKTFIRFMLYQEESDELPHSHPYVYVYVKNIDECTYASHKKALINVPEGYFACEICYPKRGFFYMFPQSEWSDGSIKHVIMFG